MNCPSHRSARRWRQARHERGFTLIELLVVVAILGILAAMAVRLYVGMEARARTAKAQADTRSIASALVQYSVHCGGLPGTGVAGGDTCTTVGGGAAIGTWQAGLTNQVTNPGGQQAGPFITAIPTAPAGWLAYTVQYPAQARTPVLGCPGGGGTPAGPAGTFDVETQSSNGDIPAGTFVVSPSC